MPIEDSELMQCPYDPHHQIRPERMQVHLGRCRRNHKHLVQTTAVCPFNVTHVVNKLEIDLHVANCDSRVSFEKYKYREDPTTRPTPLPPQPVMPVIETSENWADDPDVPTYDPQVYVAKANILRNLKGHTASQKKHFRATEHIRLNELRNGMETVEKAMAKAKAIAETMNEDSSWQTVNTKSTEKKAKGKSMFSNANITPAFTFKH